MVLKDARRLVFLVETDPLHQNPNEGKIFLWLGLYNIA